MAFTSRTFHAMYLAAGSFVFANLRSGSIFVSLCNNIPAGKANRKQSLMQEGKRFSKRQRHNVLLVLLFWLDAPEFKILKFLFFYCLNIFMNQKSEFSEFPWHILRHIFLPSDHKTIKKTAIDPSVSADGGSFPKTTTRGISAFNVRRFRQPIRSCGIVQTANRRY